MENKQQELTQEEEKVLQAWDDAYGITPPPVDQINIELNTLAEARFAEAYDDFDGRELAYSGFGEELRKEIDAQVVGQIVALSQTGISNTAQYTITIPQSVGLADVVSNANDQLITSYEYTVEEPIVHSIEPVFEIRESGLAMDNAVSIFGKTGDLVVQIKTTGEVTLGKDVHPQFAALEFWDRLAEIGGNFERRMDELHNELDDLRTAYADAMEEIEDEQSQKIDLQSIINDIGEALGAPEAMEIDLADIAAKMKAELEEAVKLIREQRSACKEAAPKESGDVQANNAYERAMKIVR